MNHLQNILNQFRQQSKTEREKGTYFESLMLRYFSTEPKYKSLYSEVSTYGDWAQRRGLTKTDDGIDLIAITRGSDQIHAIQCKFYSENHSVSKQDLDTFLNAGGKKCFSRNIVVSTTNNWNSKAEDSIKNRAIPVQRIDLSDLEKSVIDWSKYNPTSSDDPAKRAKKTLGDHQQEALDSVAEGLKSADRGKLIMACGTGKTFASLKIAEAIAGEGKRVLFLVPSLALLSQALTEWTQESEIALNSFAVCSDSHVGKKRKNDEDVVQMLVHELNYPATTDAERLSEEMEQRHSADEMSVVFSTYHSIDVINQAQKQYGLTNFDLIICDEAHRTTGATFGNEDESNFVKIHDADFIQGTKRIYMTATPRIYADSAKVKAEKHSATLCSMDDEDLYGKPLFTLTFSKAVESNLLVDYKVIVLTVDAEHVSGRLQELLKDGNNQLRVDDAAKIVGCWKALSKQGTEEDLTDDNNPMQRAVAFCQVIEVNRSGKVHKVSSKHIADMFQKVVEAYQAEEESNATLICEAEHVDGGMNATQKEQKLNWLKSEAPENTCRILSNVRCLSEGVDVPALDSVLFLTPKNSQIDVVQSVGRVMRIAPNKKRGYVILPVVIPENTSPHEALNDNKVYKVVWDVLQALRSHDDRFDAYVNKIDLMGDPSGKMEVIAVTDRINKKSDTPKKPKGETGVGGTSIGSPETPKGDTPQQEKFEFKVGEIERALYAKVVQKCGNRNHWAEWANDIASIAQTHITRIKTIVSDQKNTKEVTAFNSFVNELRDDLNDSITDEEVIEMLAQHLITKPVFEALFDEYSFASNNPVSHAMQAVLDILQEHHLEKEASTLNQFYNSVKERAKDIDSAQGKQKIVVELYDKFFRNAFPKMTERLGIVYTPVEVVDFIIHSVNDLLQQEFNQTLGSEGVHIIDPFVGTGTFITRLLQSGLISSEQLPYKYKNEIHANEIVLLAYYIAAVNIEAVYHSLVGGEYQPFEGICLTDTFQLYEKDDMISELLVDNSERRTRQKELDIRVIVGNPPYSAGQKSANDDNQNVSYEILDSSIEDSYAKYSSMTSVKNLYDSYIRALRWASERIVLESEDKAGIIGFVTGSGYIEKSAMDGMRKSLKDEFSSLYIFNLRGDIRKNMLSGGKAQEGQNIFGSGSMTGVAISLLIKNPNDNNQGKVYYYDIGNDLSLIDKLDLIREYQSVKNIDWSIIKPDEHNDWLSQRDNSFEQFIALGNKDRKSKITKIFSNYSLGVATGRDSWCYNSSQTGLIDNIGRMISFYNTEVERYQKSENSEIRNSINNDPSKISWSVNIKERLVKKKLLTLNSNNLIYSIYRPFNKSWFYYTRDLNERVYQMPKIFPNGELENKVICVSGVGARSGFSVLISEKIVDLQFSDNGQCFPLYLYEKQQIEEGQSSDMFNQSTEDEYIKHDGISDTGLKHFHNTYDTNTITKHDIFYYIYGLLHSEEYRARFANNLSKELPRIPCVKKLDDFWAFKQAGEMLADLHINYETVKPYEVTLDTGKKDIEDLTDEHYRVVKMKPLAKDNLETIIYNDFITIRDIPAEAYDYVVNGKPALKWVMERQVVKTDKASGIVNDANLWATETMNNAKYPLELFQRVITVSLATMKIVNSLPKLELCNK